MNLATLHRRPMPAPPPVPMKGPRFDQFDEDALAKMMREAAKPKRREDPEPSIKLTRYNHILELFVHKKRGPIELTMADIQRKGGLCGVVKRVVSDGLLSSTLRKETQIYALTKAGRERLGVE